LSEKKAILVVEDNEFVRLQIVNYMQSADYDAFQAGDADAGMDMLRAHKDEIVMALVDVRMEPKGGFAFVRMALSEGFDLPVAFVTGDETPDILEQAGKLGVGAVLMKPVEKDRLIKTVARTIEMHKRHRS
jgi:DNA-binding NtrC family response regulator